MSSGSPRPMSGIADGNNSRYPSDESLNGRRVLLLVAELHKTVLAGFLVLVLGEGVGLAFGDVYLPSVTGSNSWLRFGCFGEVGKMNGRRWSMSDGDCPSKGLELAEEN